MAKIDLGKILALAVAAGAAQVAGDSTTKMEPKDAKAVVQAAAVASKEEIKEAQQTVDVLTNQEPFYLSVQWWTQILGLLGTVAGIIGFSFPAEMQKEALAIITGLIGVGTAGAMFYNRYIRFRGVVK
jgi:hypothetical protein